MDCGDGVTVNILSDHSYNGSVPPLSVNIPVDSHTEHGNVPTNDGDKMEDVTPTGNVQVTLLHPCSCKMIEAQNSIHSVASSNSSGPLLESTVEKRGNSSPILYTDCIEDLIPRLKSAMQSPVRPSDIEQGSSTNVANKQQKVCPESLQQRLDSISCGIEESTEVLLVNSSECDEKYFGNGRAYSGTDSDVEILMSEEIIESDFSAGTTATDEMAQTPDEAAEAMTAAKVSNLTLKMEENCQKQNKMIGSELVKEESTDQEISVEDLSSNGANEQLNKEQLIKIIGEQTTCIQKLENKIERYRRTHQTLLIHVEALRCALNETDFNVNDVDKLGSQK